MKGNVVVLIHPRSVSLVRVVEGVSSQSEGWGT